MRPALATVVALALVAPFASLVACAGGDDSESAASSPDGTKGPGGDAGADGGDPGGSLLFAETCGSIEGDAALAVSGDGSLRLLVRDESIPNDPRAVIHILEADGRTRARSPRLGSTAHFAKGRIGIVAHDDGSATAAWLDGLDVDAGLFVARIDDGGKVL